MKSSRSKSLPFVFSSLIAALPLSVQAQTPPEPDETVPQAEPQAVPQTARPSATKSGAKGAPKDDWGAYAKISQKAKAQAQTEPAAAIATLRGFLADHPRSGPSVQAAIWGDIGELYVDAGQLDQAQQTFDEALSSPWLATAPPYSRVRLLIGQGNRLKALKHSADIPALYAQPDNWNALVSAGQADFPRSSRIATQALLHIITGLRVQAKAEQFKASSSAGDDAAKAAAVAETTKRTASLVPDFLARYFSQAPEMLDEARQREREDTAPGILYEKVATGLSDNGQREAALRWLKLRFVTCSFEPSAVERSARQLSRIWAESDNMADVQAFAKVQDDSALPNPLATVALPALDAGALTQHLKQVMARANLNGGQPKTTAVHGAVTTLLALQQPGRAMRVARALWLAQLDKPEGVQEVGRVFKANDLSVARANFFVSFLSGPANNGPTNPVTLFLQEHPEEPEVSATTATPTPGATP